MHKSKEKAYVDSIDCPNCGTLIPITETLQNQLTEHIRNELNTEFEQQRIKLEQDAKKKAEELISLEMSDLRDQIKEKEERLKKTEAAELELRKRERKLEEEKKSLELKVARKIDAEKRKIEEEVTVRIIEERKLKEREKEKLINDLKNQIGDLKRKAEQGSQQLQGEVLELELEEYLKQQFPHDDIKRVPKGIKGGDVLHSIYSTSGHNCGIILWETKRAKNWNNNWTDKLKDDQREAQADIAILISEVLPSDINNVGLINNIWITNYGSILGIATALRQTLIQVAMTKLAVRGKNEKVEVIFNYLTGPEFRQKVEAIIDTFINMKKDIDKEKRVFARRIAEREKQVERVISNTAGMYGDLHGLIGSALQPIAALESGEDFEEESPGEQSDEE